MGWGELSISTPVNPSLILALKPELVQKYKAAKKSCSPPKKKVGHGVCVRGQFLSRRMRNTGLLGKKGMSVATAVLENSPNGSS